MSNDKTAEEIPVWYTYSEMYDRLIRENYSKEIAKELSHKWANDLQGAFSKGYEKAQRHSAQQLKEYKEVIRELLPFVEERSIGIISLSSSNKDKACLLRDRARKLIDKTDTK